MVQNSALDGAWSANDTAARRDTTSDRLSQELSLTDRQQFFDSQRTRSDSSTASSSAVSAMLGSVEIVGDSSTSATIWTDKKDSRFFRDQSSSSGFQYRAEPLDEGNGKADLYFGKGASKFSYDQIQMNADVVSKDPAPHDNRTTVRDNAYRRLQEQARAGGDADENREKAAAIGKKLLDGKDITKDLQELPETRRAAVMSELKRQLAETPGTTVAPAVEHRHPSDPSLDTRTIQIKTSDGTTVLIDEKRNGAPNRIQVNNPHWFLSSVRPAREVYVNPDLPKQESAPGYNPVLRLREQTTPFTPEQMEQFREQQKPKD